MSLRSRRTVRHLCALCLPTLLLFVGCDGDPAESEDDGGDGIDIDSQGATDSGMPTPSDDGPERETTGAAETGGGEVGDPDESDGTPADGSSSDDGPAPPSCGESMFTFQLDPTNVVLVLDKSFSMIDNQWDHDGEEGTAPVTRWSSLHSVVSTLATNFNESLNMGVVLFPAADVPDNDPVNACGVASTVDAPVAPENGDDVVASLPPADSTTIFGGTPASAGINTAVDHLLTLTDGLPQAIILVTDGAANCMEGMAGQDVFTVYDTELAPLLEEVFLGYEIPTYVVGIDIVDAIGQYPVDNPYERLNEVAVAGGVPRPGSEAFYNTNDEDELLATLDEIAGEVNCTVPLDQALKLPSLLSIAVGGDDIEWVDSCETSDVGWAWVEPEGPWDTIELCPGSCELLTGLGTLDATYSCPPQG